MIAVPPTTIVLVVIVTVCEAIAVFEFTIHAGGLVHNVAKLRVHEVTTPVPTVSNPAISEPVILGDVPHEVIVGAVLVATICVPLI